MKFLYTYIIYHNELHYHQQFYINIYIVLFQYIYRVFQNLCHKLFLGIPHPKISKKVFINMGPKMNRFRDIDLRSCAGTLLSIT